MKTLISGLILVAAMAAHGQAPGWKLNVGGKPVDATLIEINGIVYAPIADTVRALGCDVSVKDTTINITPKTAEGANTPGGDPAKQNADPQETLGEQVRKFNFPSGAVDDIGNLIADYIFNEVDADNRYKNRICRFRGTVNRVGKEDDGSLFAIIGASVDRNDKRIRKTECFAVCYFPASEAKAVATLQPGNRVLLRGFGAGELAPFRPKLIGCHIDMILADLKQLDAPEFVGGAATNIMPVAAAALTGTVRVFVKYFSAELHTAVVDGYSSVWLLTEDEASELRPLYGGEGVVLAAENVQVEPETVKSVIRAEERDKRITSLTTHDVCFSYTAPGNYILIVQSRNIRGKSARDKIGKYFFRKVTVKANETTEIIVDTGQGR